MDIRLVAFDLDGTLLRSDKSISPRTMQALRQTGYRKLAIAGGVASNSSLREAFDMRLRARCGFRRCGGESGFP